VHDPQPGDDPREQLATWQRPGARQQRVGGVLAAEQEGSPDEAKGAEEPADGVSWREAGGDDSPERREAHRDHGILDLLLEEGDAWQRFST
jgi:hypothetical protein